jgi:hypothetical protein
MILKMMNLTHLIGSIAMVLIAMVLIAIVLIAIVSIAMLQYAYGPAKIASSIS